MNGILFYSTFLLFLKGLFRPAHLLSSSLYNNTLVSFFIPPLLISFAFRMPPPPQPYPSFTLVMSSGPSAPFAANDNMRLPAYRTSHLARFHPYSRARPSLHQERLMVRLSRLCCSLHAQQPHQTAVNYRFPESPTSRGLVGGLASFEVRKPAVILVFVFWITETARFSP